jgi:hypothetical protein
MRGIGTEKAKDLVLEALGEQMAARAEALMGQTAEPAGRGRRR